jgi:hypothetical protein
MKRVLTVKRQREGGGKKKKKKKQQARLINLGGSRHLNVNTW